MGTEGGVKVSFGFCTSSKFVSKSHIFDNILKQLQVDNKGMPFTRCLVQNPLPTRGLPLELQAALLLVHVPLYC